MTLVKYSKPSSAVIVNKQSFFKKNDELLEYVASVNSLYKKQPMREGCKTCGTKILTEDIVIHGVPYSVCDECGHFNGLHEDTEEFADYVYNGAQGINYAANYKENYISRVNDIYEPKVSFLQEVLKSDGIVDFSVTDVGCGGGHFVAACEKLGIECVGYDTNIELIQLGNQFLEKNALQHSQLEDINSLIVSVNSPVMSLVGVLEHLMDPIGAMSAFCQSKADYLYLQVPLFSFSAILESIHPDIFPRQLNAGHTHLYTKSSIEYICNELNLDVVGEWWFGTDMVDLFRHFTIKASINPDKQSKILSETLGRHIDGLQSVLDSEKICSGVNMVIRKAR